MKPRAVLGRMATLALLLLTVAGLQGCGSSLGATVHGNVMLEGRALTRGDVQFHPIGDGPSAYASIGTNGEYTLGTGSEEGIVPGKYKVTVMATEAPPANLPAGQAPPIGKRLTPERYGTVEETPFEFEVVAGDNTIDLMLTEK